jgi:hypothetical protein
MSAGWNESAGHANGIRARQPQFDGETAGDHQNQRHDERFNVAEPTILQKQDDQHVERRQTDTPDQRQPE